MFLMVSYFDIPNRPEPGSLTCIRAAIRYRGQLQHALLSTPPSPGSSAPIPLGINLPFLLCPYSQREIFIAIPLEPGHAGGHMTQEQHLKVFLGFTQVAVKREKNPLISAGEGTRQSSVEKREGKQRDKTQGKIVSAMLESLFQNPMSFPRLLPACNSLFL